MVGEDAHAVFGFGFDHDAGEGFGAGIADDDAAVAVQFLLGGFDDVTDFGDLGERYLLAHADVLDSLGKDFEVADEIGERMTCPSHDLHDAEGGEQSVAGRGVAVAEEDVSGLFAAESGAGLLH